MRRHRDRRIYRTSSLPNSHYKASQPTFIATENLPVCPTLLGTQASPKGKVEREEEKGAIA